MKRVLLIVLVASLCACGGGGSNNGGPGALNVSITGLPSGTDAEVLVTGPSGFSRALTASAVLPNLSPGPYSVTASNVLNGSSILAPSMASQSIVVNAGDTGNAIVDYQPGGPLRLALQQFVTGLVAPLFMTSPPGDARLFAVERAGRVRLIRNGVLQPTPVLDISSRVFTQGEGGLLSLAFDPNFANNGIFFVHFIDPVAVTGRVAVERFRMSAGDPDVADPTSALRILTIDHPNFTNHYGGRVAFGPDGFLYLSVGDGGSGGDPNGNGQNLNTLLAKLLRLDVANASILQPYAIPPSNPFVGQLNRRPEIWAYGLRNPFRYSFDSAAGLLYVGDVGQNLHEEVDVAPVTSGGLNYGWNIMEGTFCFAVTPCSTTGLTLPVLDYDHSQGCSVTGGFVYRGSAIPELRGRYFYSDFCGGWLRSFRYSAGQATEQVDWNIAGVGQIYSFGEDSAGELYMLAVNNTIYKIVRQ